ncbi:uncharacterized protein LOC111126605 [Crassostrea virginica]|uniref:Uncharacterized protein LOC111126660 isoform X2 n=1 Tax=Crassostrea virginica TaxID=6565 RepID=A0A8B8DG98_CRAVI|nr:uncharacterized protein LOC111126660 isoform X2 [Crassostrea virginica]
MGDTAKPTVKVLNEQPKAGKSDLKAPDLAKKLQKTMLSIKGECIGEDRGIDYDKLKSSASYKEYKSETLFLQTVSLDELSENERKAFFINLYNALTIHGLAEQAALPSSVLDIQQFWKTTGYNVGGLVYSLDDIEHGILRGNKSHPASTKPQFSEGDPRLKYAVKKLDPRIHFALVCGAVSCPAINVYTADNLDKALDSATRNFCKQEVSMFTEVDEVWMSKIFLWYRDDFGGNAVDVIEWVMPYLEKDIQDRAVVLLFKIKNVGQVDIKYNEYDWRLNKLGVTPLIL